MHLAAGQQILETPQRRNHLLTDFVAVAAAFPFPAAATTSAGKTLDSHAFKSNRRNECVRMPRKTADQAVKHRWDGQECRKPSTLSHLGYQPVQKPPTIHVSSGLIWGKFNDRVAAKAAKVEQVA